MPNRRKMYRLQPVEEREFLFSMTEIARAARACIRAVYLWKQKHYADFPKPPTTKHAVWAFIQRHRRKTSRARIQVVELRKQGLSYSQIGERLGMSKQGAHDHYHHYLAGLKKNPSYGER